MNDYIAKNNKELKRPIFAFVTFTTQEAVERIKNHIETTSNFFNLKSNYSLKLFDIKLPVD